MISEDSSSGDIQGRVARKKGTLGQAPKDISTTVFPAKHLDQATIISTFELLLTYRNHAFHIPNPRHRGPISLQHRPRRPSIPFLCRRELRRRSPSRGLILPRSTTPTISTPPTICMLITTVTEMYNRHSALLL
jgi:hypothetical protein